MKNKCLFLFIAAFALCPILVEAQKDSPKPPLKDTNQQRYFDINKNIEIFNSVLRELDLFYVDSLDVNKVVRSGIDNMLSELDPYTVYYNTEEMKDFNFMTTGEYAGIGSGITFKDNKIVISEPFENKPAAKAGLKAGDIILEIDGEDMTHCPQVENEAYGRTLSNHVSSHLKGQPGTSILLKIERPGEKKPLMIKVLREKIQMDAVPYYGLLNLRTGYINLSSFTDKSAMEVKKAFLDLKKQGITSLVFDLRQNSGGLLEEAVQIVNLFTPKGKVVLSTKGKLKQLDRTYRTTLEPTDTEIPLVVLIDKNSASASEIVAGALQDMDRAILVGERSFGKGLVQSPREMPFGGAVKVTTSKYYIPSGRCIQAIDYSHRNADGSVGHIPDSLTSIFRTEAGRPVRDGGGVSPDVVVADDKTVTINYYLSSQYIVFEWVTNWVLKNKTIGTPQDFSISEADYQNFKEYVKSKDFKYDLLSEKAMTSLKEIMEIEGYMKTASEELKALEAKLVPNLDRDLETFKSEITQLINQEIVKRYYYQTGEYKLILKTDKEVLKALELLNSKSLYRQTLSLGSNESI